MKYAQHLHKRARLTRKSLSGYPALAWFSKFAYHVHAEHELVSNLSSNFNEPIGNR